ncbi:MAG: 2-oxoglutarate dehydrogenase complex dihydrolipoyllysine-residue succinyltransferase [Azospirillaceae bacterium]
MSIEIVVPTLGESVSEATVAQWLKKPGDSVSRDEPVVELETDKVTLEVNATGAGTLQEIKVKEGDSVEVGAVLGLIGEGGEAAAPAPAAKGDGEAAKAPAPAPSPAKAEETAAEGESDAIALPAARKLIEEHGLEASAIKGTGKGGRITKEDVLTHLEQRKDEATPAKASAPAPAPASAETGATIEVPKFERPEPKERPRQDLEERVRMTKLRRTIATRLKQAQDTAAMLTTFNEVDLTELIATRNRYRESFEKKHGVRLGFMSFFAKACVTALQELPAVNAEVEGEDIVYKNYYDIGVAVGTSQGLVVPVVRDVDKLGFAEIEKTIGDLGRKARDGKLTMGELTGGTFTITNGGVYGSLMSTPILNPPQSGILGMHKIQERPMAVNGQVEIRPMMYLALSYDHRIVDGREAVTFLVRVKECIEDPQRILLDV